MTLTLTKDDGEVITWDNVIAFDHYDKDDIKNIAEDYGISDVTDEMYSELIEKIDRCDDFPTYNHVGELFRDVLDDLEIDYDGK